MVIKTLVVPWLIYVAVVGCADSRKGQRRFAMRFGQEAIITTEDCETAVSGIPASKLTIYSDPETCLNVSSLSVQELCLAAKALSYQEEYKYAVLVRLVVVKGDYRITDFAWRHSRHGRDRLFVSSDGTVDFFSTNHYRSDLVTVHWTKGHAPEVRLNRCVYRDRETPTD